MSIYRGLRHFSEDEFDNPSSMDERFLVWLDEVRNIAGVPFVINSSYREGDHDSTHSLGIAADIDAPNGNVRYLIVKAAIVAGAQRVGVYDKHVHLELPISRQQLPSRFPMPVLWSGRSQ